MKNLYFLFPIIFTLLVSACGKATVESEQKRWTGNLQTLEKLSGEYPTFKTLIAEIKSQAEASMKNAESISDAEQKVVLMQAANELAKPRAIRSLENIKGTTQRLKDLLISAPTKVKGDNYTQSILLAVKDAENTILQTELKLKTQSPNSISEAEAMLTSIDSDLNAASKRIKDVISSYEKTEQAAKAVEEKVKQEEEKANAQIKCRSCGTMSPAKSTTCAQCGAPF